MSKKSIMPKVHLGTLTQPVDVLQYQPLLGDDSVEVSFRYKSFLVEFDVSSAPRLSWNIRFRWKDEDVQRAQTIEISEKDYAFLLLNATAFDVRRLEGGTIRRESVIEEFGVEQERLFHVQCVLHLFQLLES